MEENHEVGWFICGILLIVIIGVIPSALIIPDHHAIQLGQAICDEKYGAEFSHFEPNGGYTINEVICKELPKKEEKFDGLTIKLKGE